MKNIVLGILLIVTAIATATSILDVDISGFPLVKVLVAGAENVNVLENSQPVDIFSIEENGDLLVINYFSNEEALKGQKVELAINEAHAYYNLPLAESEAFSAFILDNAEITIDGSIDDWDKITGIRFLSGAGSSGAPISGWLDLSGIVKIAYNLTTSTLYGLLVIRDDVPIPAFSEDIIGSGDSVQLKINNILYNLLPGNFINYDPSITSSTPIENSKIACILENSHYIYEFAVPFPKNMETKELKLSISVIDNDKPKALEKTEWRVIEREELLFSTEALPTITIISPKDGDIFSRPYALLSGSVSGEYENVLVKQERIGNTGEIIPVDERVIKIENGLFHDSFILSQGENVFTVLATNTSGKAIASIKVLYPTKASLRFILKWNNPKADLDLNVMLPSGKRIYFVNPGPPGKLHIADADEALEVYEIPFDQVEPGFYTPMVHFFENKGAREIEGTLSVELSDGVSANISRELFRGSFSFNGNEANPTDTTTGTDWRYFEPIEIKIPEVAVKVLSDIPDKFKGNVTYRIGTIEHKEGFIGTYELGTSFELEVTPSLFEVDIDESVEGNDIKFEFSGWDDGISSRKREVTINEPETLLAHFKKYYKVLLVTVDNEGNELMKRKQYWVEAGKEINISSIDIEGMLFRSWLFNGQRVSTEKGPMGFTITGPSVIVREFLRTTDVMVIAPEGSAYDLEALKNTLGAENLSVGLYSPETIKENPRSLSKARMVFLGFSLPEGNFDDFFTGEIIDELRDYAKNGGTIAISGDGKALLEKFELAKLKEVSYARGTLCVPFRLLYGPEGLFDHLAFPADESTVLLSPENTDYLWKSNEEFESYVIQEYTGDFLPLHFIESLTVKESQTVKSQPLLLWKYGSGNLLYLDEIWNGKTSSSGSVNSLVTEFINLLIEGEPMIIPKPYVESVTLRGDVLALNLKEPRGKFFEVWASSKDGMAEYISTMFIFDEANLSSVDTGNISGIMLRTLSGLNASNFSDPVKITVPQPVYYEVYGSIVEIFSDERKTKKIKMRDFPDTEMISHIEYDLNKDGIDDIILIRKLKIQDPAKSDVVITALNRDISMLWEESFGDGKVYALPLSYAIVDYGIFYEGSEPYIYVVANGDNGNFSVASVYSRHGELISELWHPGPIEAVLVGDLNLDKTREILLAGYNYHYDAADYIVYNPTGIGVAQTPPGRGFFYPMSKGLAYTYFTNLETFVSVSEKGPGLFELVTEDGKIQKINLLESEK
ncbi:hypothetical protein AT15_07385 [Kosmotoga arenicorallina S304]|uniref:Uncharacterized protein n=1 Tax=Kosmotoga arenicorallina S304 TaxID=1453497 RepID=A0A182C748_9BACT|nr:hypothetical protein [Kosmotoga arenicorallina]OAA31311.1 hypothetical protein AT15_07385 [Kosmotoga arenicorallina S304]